MRLRAACHRVLEPLLFATVVFAPWALGSTAPWSERTLTFLCLLLGVLAAIATNPSQPARRSLAPVQVAFGAAWCAFLLYVLVGALNARSTAEVSPAGVSLRYHEFVPWLPHSYDGPRSREGFAKHLAIAMLFFATWRLGTLDTPPDVTSGRRAWPGWLVRLIWVASASSAVLAVVSIVQKYSGTNKLLFLVPRVLPGGGLDAASSFGPYPYQSNGAQYFNLIWPVTLGYWWCEHRRIWNVTGIRPRFGASALSLLPFFAALMMACPFLTQSRGGSLVCVIQLAGVCAILALPGQKAPAYLKAALFSGILLAVGIAATGWDQLRERFERIDNSASSRRKIYEQAGKMLADFEPWGGGADCFRRLSDLYTEPDAPKWEAYVHNDWLEAHLAYGTVGFSLLLLVLTLGFAAWLTGPWQSIPPVFSAFTLLPQIGLIIHARYDLPFQILSLAAIFSLLGAITFASPPPWVASNRRHRGRLPRPSQIKAGADAPTQPWRN